MPANEEAAAPSTMLRMVPLPRYAEEDHAAFLCCSSARAMVEPSSPGEGATSRP